MSPRVKYVGPFRPGVFLTVGRGTREERVVEVEHLHEVEVSAEERDQLLKSDDWTEVKSSSNKKED